MAKKKSDKIRATEFSEPLADPVERTIEDSALPLKSESWLSFTSAQGRSGSYPASTKETNNPISSPEYQTWPVPTEITSPITESTKEELPKRNSMEFFYFSEEPSSSKNFNDALPLDGINNSFPQSRNEPRFLSTGISSSAPSPEYKIVLPCLDSEYKVYPLSEEGISLITEKRNVSLAELLYTSDYVTIPTLENELTEKQPVNSTVLPHTFLFNEQIGAGKFSLVYKDIYTGQDAAIKIPRDHTYEAILHIQKEYFICFRLQQIQQQHSYCPNIVSLYGFDSNHTWLIMEWVEKGSLDKLLLIKPQPFLSPNPLMTDILQGAAFLHEHHIIHRDLKPANILLNNQYQAKLTDFGVAIEITEDSSSPAAGDTSWMPPEILFAFLDKLFYQPTPNNDSYNIAVILLMLICWRSEPYQTTQNFEGPPQTTRTLLDYTFIEDIRNGTRDEMPRATPPWLKSMVRQSLDKDPHNRPSARQLLQTILRHVHKDIAITQSSPLIEPEAAPSAIRKNY